MIDGPQSPAAHSHLPLLVPCSVYPSILTIDFVLSALQCCYTVVLSALCKWSPQLRPQPQWAVIGKRTSATFSTLDISSTFSAPTPTEAFSSVTSIGTGPGSVMDSATFINHRQRSPLAWAAGRTTSCSGFLCSHVLEHGNHHSLSTSELLVFVTSTSDSALEPSFTNAASQIASRIPWSTPP